MAEAKKCAHELCSCIVPADAKSKYCSEYCEDSKDITTLGCECEHPGCSAKL